MSIAFHESEVSGFFEEGHGQFGSISIRVVVLPRKEKNNDRVRDVGIDPADLEEDEFLPDEGRSPLASYLETRKGGKRCCVFLVNGQRQDALDNSFIVQQLGFKYLRNRMMIIVDVDGITPDALGRLMQGSRQGFFKGEIWDSVVARVIATLKNDPDLGRLEEEAEDQVSQLEAGDEKVKEALDQLIESHHEHGLHFSEGAGSQGGSDSRENLGVNTVLKDGVVSLVLPSQGEVADFPVLVAQPRSSTTRLRPNAERKIRLVTRPADAWAALNEFVIEADADVPELKVSHEQDNTGANILLVFREPLGFEEDQYPVHATVRATARFNGLKEPRQLELPVTIKRDVPAPDLQLIDTPSYLKVTSRQPVKITQADTDTHVRLRWDGKDHLVIGPNPAWRFEAKLTDPGISQPNLVFSEPRGGRFSLLITPHRGWTLGQTLTFAVVAIGPNNIRLTKQFAALVVEAPTQLDDPRRPRLLEKDTVTGSKRRPPYDLIYIGEKDYDGEVDCWGGKTWTEQDPGCYKERTDRAPLRLIINKDMVALREYREFLTRSKFSESEVERRITKYTSHIAFHLYQMSQADRPSKEGEGSEDMDSDTAEERQNQEIKRVAMTLIKLMEISR